jgi:hypothetical protein
MATSAVFLLFPVSAFIEGGGMRNVGKTLMSIENKWASS